MTTQLNMSYEQSMKGTQATGNGLSNNQKQPNNNINVTDLYKEDSVSSDQPIAFSLNNKAEDFLSLQQEEMQNNQIKKFMKKAEKINQMSYRKLHEGKALMPEASTINIYKSNKNILNQINFPTQRDRQIKSIYLKSGRQSKRYHEGYRNSNNNSKTFRSIKTDKKKQTSLSTSKWVQTDNVNSQTNQTLKMQNKKSFAGENVTLPIKKFKKTLRAIEEDEDQQFIPVKRKNNNNKVFNTINLAGEFKRAKVDANTYLANVSKAQHQFNKSIKRYQVKHQFRKTSTFYNESERTTNQSSFLQPIVNQSNPWENMIVEEQQKDKQDRILPIIKQKTSILEETHKHTQSNKQPELKTVKKKTYQPELTENSLFVENDNNSVAKKSKVSESQFSILKGTYQNSFPLNFRSSNQQNEAQIAKNPTTNKQAPVDQQQRMVQVPEVHQIAIGTDTNNFIKVPKKAMHSVSIGFSESDSNWITEKYQPKSQFLKNFDRRDFDIKKYRNGVYFGQLSEQGLKNGKGVVFYFNGRLYEGDFVNDVKQGKGFQYFPDGSVYTGQFQKGLKQGKGTFEWPNGQIYDGQWIAGLKSGSGMWKSPNGDVYLGQWKKGKIQGFGVLSIKSGDRYEGQFKKSMKQGLGTQRYSNGNTYVGQFSKNRPNGQGQYYYVNGDVYKGSFSNGLRHGNGYLKLKNGTTFQGQFRNEKRSGFGQQTTAEGNTYKGNFENDFKHGYGQQIAHDGTVTKGYWINGQLIETQMGPIIQDELDRQESIATNLKMPKKRKNNDKKIEEPKMRDPIAQKRSNIKKSPTKSIEKQLSPSDPNFHRSCGCRRNH